MKSTIPPQSPAGQDERCPEAVQAAGSDDKGHHARSLSAFGARGIPACAAWRVVPASPGDHPAIHQFLLSVFHRPTPAEFQAQLEEPSYEPADRLLIKSGHQVVAHLRLLHREMQFGRVTLPVGMVVDLATSPQYRGLGCATALLSAARNRLLRDGAAVAFLATNQPNYYMRRGWFVSGRHCYSTASPRTILSCLKQREAEEAGLCTSVLRRSSRKTYNIRLWRHVELAALMRLYEEKTHNSHGYLVRTSAYWRWLVGRTRELPIYVAIDGPDKLELDDTLLPIVGYAATHEGRIVEIITSAAHPEAPVQLLARACGDAIEKDFLRVRLDAPPDEPLHPLLLQAGGQYGYHEADQGMVFMASILKLRRFLRLIGRDLGERAKEAGLPRPCQLGLLVQGEKYRLSVSRHNVELVAGPLGRSYLTASLYDFNQLLLGHLNVRDAVETGRLAVSTHVALELATAFFPRLALWRSPWDDLPAE